MERSRNSITVEIIRRGKIPGKIVITMSGVPGIDEK